MKKVQLYDETHKKLKSASALSVMKIHDLASQLIDHGIKELENGNFTPKEVETKEELAES